MDKNKIELIMLMILITFGINYAVYSIYLTPALEGLDNAKVQYEKTEWKLEDLKSKSSQIETIKQETEKLKETAARLDELAPKDINTPQLVYDLYSSCKRFGITGENVSFQLMDGNQPDNAPQSSSGNTNGGTTGTSSGNSESAGQNNGKPVSGELKFMNLSVVLRVHGEKSKIEGFIKNLDTLSKRKLNVKNMTISVKTTSNTLVPGTSIFKAQNLGAVIVFNQYLQVEASMVEELRKYEFYNGKIGFASIAEMFGK